MYNRQVTASTRNAVNALRIFIKTRGWFAGRNDTRNGFGMLLIWHATITHSIFDYRSNLGNVCFFKGEKTDMKARFTEEQIIGAHRYWLKHVRACEAPGKRITEYATDHGLGVRASMTASGRW